MAEQEPIDFSDLPVDTQKALEDVYHGRRSPVLCAVPRTGKVIYAREDVKPILKKDFSMLKNLVLILIFTSIGLGMFFLLEWLFSF